MTSATGSSSLRPGPVAVPAGESAGDGHRQTRFRLSGEARGPWSDDAAHGGAPAALLAREALLAGGSRDLRLAGLSITFYGPVPLGEITIRSEVVKPGRRQLVVALRLSADGLARMEARAVLLRRGSVELPPRTLADRDRDRMADPGHGRVIDQSRWALGDGPAFHRTANTALAVEGGPDRSESLGSVWFRLDAPLVAGEETAGVERAVAASDFGNGVAHPVPFGEYLFANCDLNVSLFRDPVGEWIGIRARTDFDPGGAGVTATELFDAEGRIGTASQTLYLDRIRPTDRT